MLSYLGCRTRVEHFSTLNLLNGTQEHGSQVASFYFKVKHFKTKFQW